jgi:hypothetical protein
MHKFGHKIYTSVKKMNPVFCGEDKRYRVIHNFSTKLSVYCPFEYKYPGMCSNYRVCSIQEFVRYVVMGSIKYSILIYSSKKEYYFKYHGYLIKV